MSNMRFFKVSEGLRPFIEKILEAKKITYLCRPNGVMVPVSGKEFHRIVTRARCEQRNEQERLPMEESYFVSKVEKLDDIRSIHPEYETFYELN